MADQGAPIFEHCVLSFLEGKDFPRSQIDSLQKTVEDHLGKVSEIKRDKKIRLDEVTHIISTTSDFPQYSAARNAMINVVNPRWVLESLHKNKAAPTRPYTPDPNLIFSSTIVSCADIPAGDKDAIVGAVLAMGGSESSALTKVCTHLCALSMDHPKCRLVIEKGLQCKIILPHWFDDCLRLGKRISEEPYLLPDPEILRVKPDEMVAIPAAEHIAGALSTRPESLPMAAGSPRRLDVFHGKTLMMSEDLEIGTRLRKILEDLIKDGGGSITNSVHNADMYVCHWRGGRDYVAASCAGKDVGNLAWLYHLITHNEWTSPMKRLLHYPVPKGGIPGFQGLCITLSNYGGDARTYLENLITATGAEFTKSMKETNTHVVTARNSGEKCKAAAEWEIEMINHLWIEESYARCDKQRLTDPRYTHFPPRTNLGEVIGQTAFNMEALKKAYFPRSPTPSPSSLSRPVMHEKDRNLSNTREDEEDVSMDDDDDEDIPAETLPIVQKKAVAKTRSKPTMAALSTPSANRRISAGKENDTPSSTGSRSAKDRALKNLHGLAPDIALYETEKKRKGPVWGGKRAANEVDKQKSSSPLRREEEEQFSAEETPKAKRQRMSLDKKKSTTSTLPVPIEVNLLVTSYTGWVDNPSKEDSDKKKLRELGIHVVQEAKKCTHLAAPNMVRTKKFLCALANGPTIISTDFIDDCVKTKKGAGMPEINSYHLKDAASEKKFSLKLKDAVLRAKANKKSLLSRTLVYCTKDIPNGADTYNDIVRANGGLCAIYTGKPVFKKINPEDDPVGPEPVYLLSGSKPSERKLWAGFIEEAKAGNMEPRVVTTDWLLDVAMAQQLKWDTKFMVDIEE